MTLTSTVTIEGLGATSLAVSGNNTGAPFSIFSLTAAANATIEGLTFENGLGITGGAFNNGGTLTLANSVVSNNSAYGVGGGIYNTGELTLVDDTLSGNSANGADNGIFSTGPGLTITADASAAVSTISDDIVLSGTPGLDLTGSGTINISGNIDLGPIGDVNVSGSGNDMISGVISGTATQAGVTTAGLVGQYFNLGGSQSLLQTSNSNWLGNQTPVVTAQLIGPLDFPDIASNGFLDTEGNQYYNLGNGNNNNVEGRWYGDIMVPTPDGYTSGTVPVNFSISHDDGTTLYIDGNEVINAGCCAGNPGYHGHRESDAGPARHRRGILPGRRWR